MPIASGKTIEMMAQYGLKAMVTLNGEKILDDVVRAYHAACHKHGRNNALGEDMIWGAGVYLADSQEEAIRKLEPAHDERFKWFAPFGFVRYADEQGRTWGTPGAPSRTPSLNDGVAQKAWFCGTAGRGDRRHQVDRGEISGAGAFHDPLGRRTFAQGVQGAAALVRQGRDAGVQALNSAPCAPGASAPRSQARGSPSWRRCRRPARRIGRDKGRSRRRRWRRPIAA